MHCNTCRRPGKFTLKLGFAQKKREDGMPRMVIAFETEGKYCVECQGRIDRKTKAGLFEEIIGADVRSQVGVFFTVKGWGEPVWNDTTVEWLDDTGKTVGVSSEAIAVPLGKMEGKA
jgi:hypothetical protein